MYNVHSMKYLKVAEARERFGEMLDTAEGGQPVFIERRGVRFKVSVEPVRRSGGIEGSPFDFVAADVMTGRWTWTTGSKGLRFVPRKKRR